eukprot:TRINITY_DN5836_c0_g1_i1.p1 TRINITY_DN5836_c0_g1~~TRINITY_DN5836_c0_g1_i1.p1  ORF type:complete len:406 (+),score=58.18 TRINITY_DN5836_c0_g1_i1:49-1266(+)
MIGSFFVLSSRGNVLISRIFRDDDGETGAYWWAADAFRLQVLNAKDIRSPIKGIGNTALFFMRHGEVYLLCTSAINQNVDCCAMFEVMRQLLKVFQSYLGGRFDEESIRNNFVLLYELLDEMLDYGFPQTTDSDSLKLYITQGKAKKARTTTDKMKNLTVQMTGAGPCPWREPNIRHRKNELFIDVVESVHVLISASGSVLHANVEGQILLKSQLSGMPECKLGLNDKLLMSKEARARDRDGIRKSRTNVIELEDCTFHSCVRLGKFDADRSISFIPPEGMFELMKYRCSENVTLPFRVIPTVNEISRTRIEVHVTIKANFKPKNFGSNVGIRVPLPKNAATATIRVTSGRAKYSPEDEGIVWQIKKLQGGSEAQLSAEVKLLETVALDKAVWSRPPIAMSFQVR